MYPGHNEAHVFPVQSQCDDAGDGCMHSGQTAATGETVHCKTERVVSAEKPLLKDLPDGIGRPLY